MAHTRSARKRIRLAEKRRLRNKAVRTRIKTAARRFRESLETRDPARVEAAFREVVSVLDRAARKGVIHRNAAARKKARLARIRNAALVAADGA
ncbi:MAG: 30S ribosomal protein S20 [Clostridia bacterium]|nr:30S ribosomal protein S20 [Clostridia bacterium]